MIELVPPAVSLAGFGVAVFLVKRTVSGSEVRMTQALTQFQVEIKESLKELKKETKEWTDELKKETKERTDELQEDLDGLEELHHACQRNLPMAFAGKKETDELFERQRKVEGDLSYFKGRLNGVSKPDGG